MSELLPEALGLARLVAGHSDSLVNGCVDEWSRRRGRRSLVSLLASSSPLSSLESESEESFIRVKEPRVLAVFRVVLMGLFFAERLRRDTPRLLRLRPRAVGKQSEDIRSVSE